MSGDGKFFLAIIGLAVLAVVGFVLFGGKSNSTGYTPNSSLGQKLGSNDAPVKIVEFGDFQCPACKAAAAPLKQAYEKNKKNVQLSFLHFPLTTHPNADEGSQAAEAAGSQGRFWEMYDLLYADQDNWAQQSNPLTQFEAYAESLGIDVDKFKSDYSSSAVAKKIRDDLAEGNKAQVASTPTFFVNGERIVGAKSSSQWQEIIDRKLLEVAGQ